MIVAFPRHTLLPLDDCLYALQATIPHLTRSALHRCLQRHGINRLTDMTGDKPAKEKFKAYPIGYFHIDIADVRTEEGKLQIGPARIPRCISPASAGPPGRCVCRLRRPVSQRRHREACWAQIRRKVFDLHERLPTPLTADILKRISALYGVEAEVRGQPPDVRHLARQDRTKPLVAALREVLDAALRRLSPRSDMAKAIVYGTKRWPALCRLLDDCQLEIDNNIAERALRGIAVGRRNQLFAGSRPGGERAAAIYTIIQNCKANGVDPETYIADVIVRIADDWPASHLDELMPWNWVGTADQPIAQAA